MEKEVNLNKDIENLINRLTKSEITELIEYIKDKYYSEDINTRKLLCIFKEDIENNIKEEINELFPTGMPKRLVELSTLKLLEECCNNGYEMNDDLKGNFRSFLRIQLMYLHIKSKKYFNRFMNINYEYIINNSSNYPDQYDSIKKFFNCDNLEESSIYLKLIVIKIFDFNNPKLFENTSDSIQKDREYINYLIRDMK